MAVCAAAELHWNCQAALVSTLESDKESGGPISDHDYAVENGCPVLIAVGKDSWAREREPGGGGRVLLPPCEQAPSPPPLQWPCIVVVPLVSPVGIQKTYAASSKKGKTLVLYLGRDAASFDCVSLANTSPFDGPRHAEFLALAGGPKARPNTFNEAIATAQTLLAMPREQRVAWVSQLLGIPPPTPKQIDDFAAAAAAAEAGAAAAAVDKIAQAVQSVGLGSEAAQGAANSDGDVAMAPNVAEQPSADAEQSAEQPAAADGTEAPAAPLAGSKRRGAPLHAAPSSAASKRSTALKAKAATPDPAAAAAAPAPAELPASQRGAAAKGSAAAAPPKPPAKAAAAAAASSAKPLTKAAVAAAAARAAPPPAAPPLAPAPAAKAAPPKAAPKSAAIVISDDEDDGQPANRARAAAPEPAAAAAPPLAGAKRGRGKQPAAVIVISDDEPDEPPQAPPSGRALRAAKKR